MMFSSLSRSFVRTAVFAVLIASASGSRAQLLNTDDTSANAVFFGCKAFVEGQATNAQSLMMSNFCSGVVHGLAYVGKALPPQVRYCAPPTSTAQQLARVAVQYIQANPQRMHEDFRELTMEAFHYAWPCN